MVFLKFSILLFLSVSATCFVQNAFLNQLRTKEIVRFSGCCCSGPVKMHFKTSGNRKLDVLDQCSSLGIDTAWSRRNLISCGVLVASVIFRRKTEAVEMQRPEDESAFYSRWPYARPADILPFIYETSKAGDVDGILAAMDEVALAAPPVPDSTRTEQNRAVRDALPHVQAGRREGQDSGRGAVSSARPPQGFAAVMRPIHHGGLLPADQTRPAAPPPAPPPAFAPIPKPAAVPHNSPQTAPFRPPPRSTSPPATGGGQRAPAADELGTGISGGSHRCVRRPSQQAPAAPCRTCCAPRSGPAAPLACRPARLPRRSPAAPLSSRAARIPGARLPCRSRSGRSPALPLAFRALACLAARVPVAGLPRRKTGQTHL